MKKFFKNSYLAFIFLILYLPILVLIIFSFNSNKSTRNFGDWSWNAYRVLWQETSLWQSLSVTLIVALISTLVAVIIGTFAALGLSKARKLTRNMTLAVTNIPLINADIVTAVSLMLLFSAFAFNFGIFTLILAHISFNIPYVIIAILPKIRAIDQAQLEASQDLGATPWYTLRKVVLPTIKPAIFTGAAIAFAMSFDDFIISYFTSGNAANVSTYIYSLKRTQPYINAFSTLIIIIVALIVIIANAYQIIKKQIRIRNERIMNQTYRDQKITKLETVLLKTYLQINSILTMKKTKKTLFSSSPSAKNWLENRLAQPKVKKLSIKAEKLDKKIMVEYQWLENIKDNITAKKQEKETRARILRDKYYFLRWPWKMICITILSMSIFTGVFVFYFSTTRYDLKIANWDGYISQTTLKNFENRYGVRVKYSTYDDNESLYAKLETTKYDLIGPSNEMACKLWNEGRIELLDEKKLAKWRSNTNKTLATHMKKYCVGSNKTSLWDFGVTQYWGDLALVFNLENKPDLLTKLALTKFEDATWEVIPKALNSGLKVVLNDDMHNLFMLGLVTLHYQNHWKENSDSTFNDYVNPHSEQEVLDVAAWLKPIIQNPNTSLQNDNLLDTITYGSNKNWDIAFAYNGDIVNALSTAWEDDNVQPEYKVVRPYTGTNLWNDVFVILKDAQNKDLAYKFINFIMEDEQQEALSSEFGYTSPLQNIIDKISEKYRDFPTLAKAYQPTMDQIAPANASKPADFFNGFYRRSFATVMQTEFNKLLANQGGDKQSLALLLQLLLVLFIIIAFILIVIVIK